MQIGNVTLDTLETHTKNPLTTKVFREMKWAEELGSGKKNIKKYAPLYYDKYEIEIQNNEKFVFSIAYRNENETFVEYGKEPSDQTGTKQDSSRYQVGTKQEPSKYQVGIKQEQILVFCSNPQDMKDIMSIFEYKNRSKFRRYYIKPLLDEGLLSMTYPDNPNHKEQKYIITEKGKEICCRE